MTRTRVYKHVSL